MDDSKSTQRKLARNIYWKKRLFSFRYERNEEKKLKGAVRVVCFNLFSECSSMLFLYRRWNHAQREFSLINKMSNAVLSPIFRFEKLINTDDNFPRTRNRFGRELEKRCAAREKRMCVSVPVWTLSEQNNQMFVCGWCEGSSLLCKRKNKIIDNGKALPYKTDLFFSLTPIWTAAKRMKTRRRRSKFYNNKRNMRSVTQFSNAPIEWCRSPFCMHQHQQQHRAAHNFHFDLMLPFIAPFIFLAHSNSHTKKISCCFFSLSFCPSRSFQLLLSFVGAEQTFSFHRFRSRCATKCSSSSLFPLCVCFFSREPKNNPFLLSSFLCAGTMKI